MWSFGRDLRTRTVASGKIDRGNKRRHVFTIETQQEEVATERPRRAGTCEPRGAATGLRARQRPLTQRRDLK